MRTDATKRFEMLKRVRAFGAAQTAIFSAPTLGQQLFAAVGEAVAAVEQSAANQSSGLNAALGGTASKATLREELRDELAVINRTARSLAYDTPGLESKFRLPRGSSDQALLNAARAFAADADPLREAFVSHELPATFLDDLHACIAAFEQALNQRTTARGAHVEATAALDAALERGVTAARRLDAVVRNKFRDDPAKLAAWATASHTERTPRTTPPKPAKPEPTKPEPPKPEPPQS